MKGLSSRVAYLGWSVGFFYPVFEVKSRLGSGKDILMEEAYLGPC